MPARAGWLGLREPLLTASRPGAAPAKTTTRHEYPEEYSIFKDFPIGRGDRWRLDIPDDPRSAFHAPHQPALAGRCDGHQLCDRLPPLGNADRLTGLLHLVEECQAGGFEARCVNRLHI